MNFRFHYFNRCLHESVAVLEVPLHNNQTVITKHQSIGFGDRQPSGGVCNKIMKFYAFAMCTLAYKCAKLCMYVYIIFVCELCITGCHSKLTSVGSVYGLRFYTRHFNFVKPQNSNFCRNFFKRILRLLFC